MSSSKKPPPLNSNDQEIYPAPMLATAIQPQSDETPCQLELEASRIDQRELTESFAIRSMLRLIAALLALFLSLFLAALDFAIATTAIPTIAKELHSNSGYTWIGSAYLLASAASTPVWAKLSDIWGRKIILLSAVAAFFAGSAVCATSITFDILIVGRSIQGCAAGGMIILVNICISDLFSTRVRGFYLGLTGVVWGLASGVGPPLGGALTQYVSWRWNWWINLPCSGFAFIVLCFCLHVHNPHTNILLGVQAIDWWGTITILGLTVMILLGLNLGGVINPWGSPKVVCLIIFGLFTSAIFVLYEAKVAKNPLMPLRILQYRSNVATLMVCFTHGFVNVSSWYYLPLYFQAVKGATPFHSGILILPITLSQSSVGVAAGIIIYRTGRYLELIWVGMIFTTLGFGLFIRLGAESSLVEIVLLQILAGLGVGLVFQPPLIALQTLVAKDEIAAATALFGFFRSISTSISIITGGAVFQNEMQSQYDELQSILPASVAKGFDGASAAANIEAIMTLTPAQSAVVRESYAKSLRSMWMMYTCVAAVGLLLSMFVSQRELSKEHAETKKGLKEHTERKNGQNISRVEPYFHAANHVSPGYGKAKHAPRRILEAVV